MTCHIAQFIRHEVLTGRGVKTKPQFVNCDCQILGFLTSNLEPKVTLSELNSDTIYKWREMRETNRGEEN